jgi:phosphoglycolate phosphatase-like HAD superfamily hydrolase
MAPEACIALDLDGTLVACEPRHLAVLRACLNRCGVDGIDISAIWRRKREGASTEAALVEEGLDRGQARLISGAWVEMIEDYPWLTLDHTFPGVHDLLLELVRAGIAPVLLTARSRPPMLALELDRLGLRDVFAEIVVVSPTEAAGAKADHLERIRPLVFIGDTEIDARAAALARTPFRAVAHGQRSAAFLRQHGITHVHSDLHEAVSLSVAGIVALAKRGDDGHGLHTGGPRRRY